MLPQPTTQLTVLLKQWRTGDEDALGEIMPAVYTELHRIASGYMRRQPEQHTLQATALVNEAFMRLRDINIELANRDHFIGIVANVMRQILVDHARAKAALKRGGDAQRVDLEEAQLQSPQPSDDVLALEEVLKALEKRDPRKVRIAELFYFCGATYEETATTLAISQATLARELKVLKMLLAHSLESPS